MISIAKNLRLLRQGKNLTQEELAAFLNVSSQAVSKWESDKSYPDITLLPALAQFFDVAVDDLLGMDDIKSKAERDAIISRAEELINNADEAKYIEAVELLRETLKFYTDDYGMMRFLSQLLISNGNLGETAVYEAIALEERIFAESKDNAERYEALKRLAIFYGNLGDTEKALEYADQLSEIEQTREWVLSRFVFHGAERVPHIQRMIKS
jgi:transcriptional regulator with XRE-family HTH domain